MLKMFLNNSNPITDVLFTLLILAFFLIVIFFLIKSIRKEKMEIIENRMKNAKGGLDFKKFLQRKIKTANRKTSFTVMQIDLYDYESLENNLGKVQMEGAKNELVDRLAFLMTEGTKSFIEEGSVFIYIKDQYTVKQLEYYLKAVLAQSQKPFTLVGSLKVDIDINICVVSYPDGGKNFEEFMNSLELAMIFSKRIGINAYKIYDKQLANEQTEEYKYYKEIREAIDNRDFTLFYQPIMNINKMKIIGAESLLRWNHKTMGILPPAKFLNILEHSGDIYWVGLWAFEQLVRQHQQLKLRFPDADLMLSMNLSPKQLLNPELINEFKRILLKHREDASQFCMEIVEFAMFDKVEIIQENILRLHQMGFEIAIDNYGLEFTTISLLENLPIDVIKLNKKFFSKTDGSFTKNIIEMLNKQAREKNMKIIAEGVEDTESLEIMKSLNIFYGQGYYFSKPMSADDLQETIKENITQAIKENIEAE